jgi:hypothetical protein
MMGDVELVVALWCRSQLGIDAIGVYVVVAGGVGRVLLDMVFDSLSRNRR